jgi:hypothetical protein
MSRRFFPGDPKTREAVKGAVVKNGFYRQPPALPQMIMGHRLLPGGDKPPPSGSSPRSTASNSTSSLLALAAGMPGCADPIGDVAIRQTATRSPLPEISTRPRGRGSREVSGWLRFPFSRKWPPGFDRPRGREPNHSPAHREVALRWLARWLHRLESRARRDNPGRGFAGPEIPGARPAAADLNSVSSQFGPRLPGS